MGFMNGKWTQSGVQVGKIEREFLCFLGDWPKHTPIDIFERIPNKQRGNRIQKGKGHSNSSIGVRLIKFASPAPKYFCGLPSPNHKPAIGIAPLWLFSQLLFVYSLFAFCFGPPRRGFIFGLRLAPFFGVHGNCVNVNAVDSGKITPNWLEPILSLCIMCGW